MSTPSIKSPEQINREVVAYELWSELKKYGEVPSKMDLNYEPVLSGLLDSISLLKFVLFLNKNYDKAISLDSIISGEYKTVADFVDCIC